ncbi:hypothetical protein A3B56_01180 [Candidatus Roizmanbacteria bacterium RIFCSPLOWO2_01_FULL_45_11]|uniref:Undecaprenyl-phosphate alpha-N-acetylglucosaminyl 1-phosphate transferase n=1 Tax=Candidatus Roizmanbacteria bacterium RIFCSPLOWO2_01_FULL_45_11 TaxID=1802070 RepID=A0A1F7JIS0_9BACT|nr:MAG: hypothetical protein A3B56_01180 [Candidatus Roizmanbacteria bacterium RIFCSPLOWO2_01_FULL_45_11]
MNGFFIALVLCFVLTPLTIRFAQRFGLVDDPKKRYHPAQTHVGIVPRAGGIALYLSICIASLIYAPWSYQLFAILLASAIAVAVGVWDDYHDVSPYIRLFFNLVSALIVTVSGVSILYITNPLGGILQLDSYIITVGIYAIPVIAAVAQLVWIVWMMNAIGWSAGVDGQLPGFVVISSIVIALVAGRFVAQDPSQVSTITLALITAGAFAGFLPWNFYPQRIMPGYGGKSLAGFLLAVLAVLSSAKVGTALLVLSVPFVDGVFTLIRRIVMKKSPFQADRGHLHHILLSRGWGKRRVALFYWAFSAAMGIIALNVDSQGKVFAFLIAVLVLGGGLLFLRIY